MTVLQKTTALGLGFCLMTGPAFAGGLSGVYRTEPSAAGRVLYVTFGSCASDQTLTCATITAAFTAGQEPIKDYANLGTPIVWDMRDNGGGKYSGGKIWDPTANKTYKSKMRLRGGLIRVSGCIGPICKSQNWVAVK